MATWHCFITSLSRLDPPFLAFGLSSPLCRPFYLRFRA
jgi:hypothetical protein